MTAVQLTASASQSRLLPGLVSITFRHLSPRNIVDTASDAQMIGIEWGGDVHVPHGNLARAREVGRMTRNAGLSVAAYGSYYVVGKSEGEGLSFEAILDTAQALGTTLVRVWAGEQAVSHTDSGSYDAIRSDAARISTMAQAAGVTVAFEFHAGTLTESAESTLALLLAIHHPNLFTLWQPTLAADDPANELSLRLLLPFVSNLHVFQWGPCGFNDRRPLREGAGRWNSLLRILAMTGLTHYVLLEYVAQDSPSSFLRDAQTLRDCLHAASSHGLE